MNYLAEIQKAIDTISVTIVDFTVERTKTSAPTQASSNFITNKEQGDWAENLIFEAINSASQNYVAVKYGKSDDLIAGDEGFSDFYQDFQTELDTIGKRPDILIFATKDYKSDLGKDISKLSNSEIASYVKKAVAGLEVRSSAFLIEKYEKEMQAKQQFHTNHAMQIKNKILNGYNDLLQDNKRLKYHDLLQSITIDNIDTISFKRPSWRSSTRLQELTELFRELKDSIKELHKRDYLSITPKTEDLKVVLKWIETFEVPHYYVQVFFDKVYGVSFLEILNLLGNTEKESEVYEISGDIKNQNKTTIKINTKYTQELAAKIDEPNHRSVRRELNRGRLLFYVTFEGGTAYLNISKLQELLNITDF